MAGISVQLFGDCPTKCTSQSIARDRTAFLHRIWGPLSLAFSLMGFPLTFSSWSGCSNSFLCFFKPGRFSFPYFTHAARTAGSCPPAPSCKSGNSFSTVHCVQVSTFSRICLLWVTFQHSQTLYFMFCLCFLVFIFRRVGLKETVIRRSQLYILKNFIYYKSLKI